jgi:hypothetical protein
MLINVINTTQPYSEVLPNATGCNWTIEVEASGNSSLLVPSAYAGSKRCYYTNASHSVAGHDTQDAYDAAIYKFLIFLDYNNDGRIALNFESSDFSVSSKIVQDVPYLWGPTIAEMRVWQ